MNLGVAIGRRRAALVLLALACIAAVTTIVVARTLSPHGTADLDEVAYQAQANAISHHRLTLPAATFDPFFRPFLSGTRGHAIVFKYQPEWPALIAASNAGFGSTLPLRVALTMAGVIGTAWFAWELLRDKRVASLSAALVVASPFVWVQGASLLGYQLSFVLGVAGAAAFLRALRSPTIWNGVVSGALLGLGVLHRPFDALLATAPVLVYVVWSAFRRRDVARRIGPVALGGAPFAAAFFAFNWRVMGSVTHLAYNVTGKSDTFGFGWRSSFETPGAGRNLQLHYTPGRAFASLGHLFVVLPRFVAFAPVVIGLAAYCAWSRRVDPRGRLLTAMILVVVAGYFFWWGVANSYQYKLDLSLGPFYYYPVLAPLCVLAAWAAFSVKWSRSCVIASVVVALAWAGIASAVVLRDARNAGLARSREVAALSPPGPAPKLVLEPTLFAHDPYLRVVNDANLRARRLTAVEVQGRLFEVIDRFPGRTVYAVREYRPFGELFAKPYETRTELRVTRGTRIAAHVRVALGAHQTGSVYLQMGARAPVVSAPGTGTFVTDVRVDAASVPSDMAITFGVVISGGERLSCSAEGRPTGDGELELLEPCVGQHRYEFPNGSAATDAEDVTSRLSVTFTGS